MARDAMARDGGNHVALSRPGELAERLDAYAAGRSGGDAC